MQETSVSVTQLLAYSLWGGTTILILASWATYLVSHDMAIMLATCGCVCAIGASTASIRYYAVRVARLVRAAGSIRADARIHSVHE